MLELERTVGEEVELAQEVYLLSLVVLSEVIPLVFSD